MLKHAFEGKLTAQWRKENKDKLEKPEQLLARIRQERSARYERQLQEWKTIAVKECGGESGKPGRKPLTAEEATRNSWMFPDDVSAKLPQLPESLVCAYSLGQHDLLSEILVTAHKKLQKAGIVSGTS